MPATTVDVEIEYQGDLGLITSMPQVGSGEVTYEGSFVGGSSGYARGLVAGDTYYGVAMEQSTNAGSNGDEKVRVCREMYRWYDVTGVTAVTDHDADVYASDDQTLTLTSTSNTKVGKILLYSGTGTRCLVHLKADGLLVT